MESVAQSQRILRTPQSRAEVGAEAARGKANLPGRDNVTLSCDVHLCSGQPKGRADSERWSTMSYASQGVITWPRHLSLHQWTLLSLTEFFVLETVTSCLLLNPHFIWTCHRHLKCRMSQTEVLIFTPAPISSSSSNQTPVFIFCC